MAKRKEFNIGKELEEGISQTLASGQKNVGQLRYEIIPIDRIELDPENPRELKLQKQDLLIGINFNDSLKQEKEVEKEQLASLAESIKKLGVRNAIEVYKYGPNYRLISGERRLLASILAEKDEIPVKILEKKPDELDLRLLQWIENIEREDLSLYEKITNISQLKDAFEKNHQMKLNSTSLAELLGCSRNTASNYLTVLDSDEYVIDSIKAASINNLEKAAYISRNFFEDKEFLKYLIDECQRGISLNDLKKKVEERKNRNHSAAIKPEVKGRKKRYITMGRTNNTNVIKKIVNLILASPIYCKYQEEFDDIIWEDFQKVNKAFLKILKIMEKTE